MLEIDNTVLIHHLKGSRLFPGLIHNKSDYDWQGVVLENEIKIDGSFITLRNKLRLLNDFNDNEYVSLFVKNEYIKTLHPAWNYLRENKHYFLTYERLFKLRQSFINRLTYVEISNYKYYAEILRRGWSLLHMLKTGEYLFDFDQHKIDILQSIRLENKFNKEEIENLYKSLAYDLCYTNIINITSNFNLNNWLRDLNYVD